MNIQNTLQNTLPQLLFILCGLLLILPTVHGLTVTGMKLSPIIYEPGKTITVDYLISGTDRNTTITVGGDFAEHISLSEPEGNRFTMVIQFPPELPPPGTYSFSLAVEEVGDPSVPLGSLLSVNKRFVVEVYSPTKELLASLHAGSVNEGTPVPLTLSVESRGYEDIERVQGIISVYEAADSADFAGSTGNAAGNVLLGTVTTPVKALPALATETLSVLFDTHGLRAGRYAASGAVLYDGRQKEANATFRIGNLSVELENYTAELQQGFSEFKAIVRSMWGEEIHNVYALLSVNGETLLHTPSITLPPWERGVLGGIINVSLLPGAYEGSFHLFFEGEQKEELVNITVMEPPKDSGTFPLLAALLAFLLLAVVLLIALLLGKRRKGS